jgi:cytochrome c5
LCAYFLSIGVAACGGSDSAAPPDATPPPEGMATGATCPAASTLTYDTFGRNFMSKYCTKCHSSAATDRHGAPADHNFDTLAGILAMPDHIDMHAAAGPNATNTIMPPAGETAPTIDERMQLGQWLACETESTDGGATDGGDSSAGRGDSGDSGGGRGDGRSDGTQSEGGRGDR